MAELLNQLKNELQAATSSPEEQEAQRIDEVEEGGRYIVNGVAYNADGEPLQTFSSSQTDEEQPALADKVKVAEGAERVEGPLDSTPVNSEPLDAHRLNQEEIQVQAPSNDYDTLTVAEVNKRLDSGEFSRDAVVAYEQANKNRSGITGG